MSRKFVYLLFVISILLATTGAMPSATPMRTWEQVNAPDFVVPAVQITALEEFQGRLCAGVQHGFYTYSEAGSSGVWCSPDGVSWTKVLDTGLFDWQHFGKFNDQLYLGGFYFDGVNVSGKIMRTMDGGGWETILADGFGDINNKIVSNLIEFKDMLYAGTFNAQWDPAHPPATGSQIWRSPSGDPGTWEQVFNPNDPTLEQVTSFYPFHGWLYAAFETFGYDPFQLWRTMDGKNWEAVITDGFGNPLNISSGNLVEYQGYLYLGAGGLGAEEVGGGELWRSKDGLNWENVFKGGLGNSLNAKVESLVTYQDDLYLVMGNWASGLVVMRSHDGTVWETASLNGFGDPGNVSTQWGASVHVFKGGLYMGTLKITEANPSGEAGEIWRLR